VHPRAAAVLLPAVRDLDGRTGHAPAPLIDDPAGPEATGRQPQLAEVAVSGGDPSLDPEHTGGEALACSAARAPDDDTDLLAPTFRFTDGKGRETRRTVGWLGPADFGAELALARGQAAMTRGRFDDALALLEGVDDAAMAAPEARYYEGVAAFLRGKRDMAALKERWVRLRERHPHSDWANKAEVIEDWNG